MGISTCNQCLSKGEKQFELNGQIQVITTLKEILRQLPVNIEGKIKENRMYLFQKSLTPTSSSAIFPYDAAQQFCFICSDGTYNQVEKNDLNTFQPNFLYILTDAPTLFYFGYIDNLTTFFVTPGTSGEKLDPLPKSVNNGIVVNGFFIINTYNTNKKIAPTNITELSNWEYSGNYGGTAGSWVNASGFSDASIIFPIKAVKISSIDVASILIFACQVI